jgi:AcrR family transcriptional regulator
MPVTTGRPLLLADAAIGLIAGSGIRSLTHRAVDASADVPPGTTSYHYRTRRELLRGVLTRIAAINQARLARLSGPPADPGHAPATRAERLAEAWALAERVAVFIDGQLSDHRPATLARMACEIEVASDPDLREILHAGDIFRRLAIGAVSRLGATDPPRQAEGLIALLDGLQYDRLVGVGSLTAAPAGTAECRAEIVAVVRTYLVGMVAH